MPLHRIPQTATGLVAALPARSARAFTTTSSAAYSSSRNALPGPSRLSRPANPVTLLGRSNAVQRLPVQQALIGLHRRGFASSRPVAASWWPFGGDSASSQSNAAPSQTSPSKEALAGTEQPLAHTPEASAASGSIADQASTIDPSMSDTLIEVVPKTFAEIEKSWWPNVNAVEGFLHYLMDLTHLPWWGLIIASTVTVRLLIFPLVVRGQANAVRMANIQPQLQAAMADLQEQKRRGDVNGTQQALLASTKVMQDGKCHPLKSLILPVVQGPIFISFFFALKHLAENNLVTMKTGGLGYLTDLTMSDPYGITPILAGATALAVVETGAEMGAGSANNQQMQTARWVIRGITVLFPFFVWNYPAAVFYYWITNNTFSMTQLMILQIPAVRKFWGMPDRIPPPAGHQPPKMSFMESVRAGYDSQRRPAPQQGQPAGRPSPAPTGRPRPNVAHQQDAAYAKWIKPQQPASRSAEDGSTALFEEEAGASSPSSSSAARRTVTASAEDVAKRIAQEERRVQLETEKQRRIVAARQKRSRVNRR